MTSLKGWTIVFDLDGTLVETAPDLLNALNHVLGRENHPPLALDQIRDMIGHGAKAMIRKGWERSGLPLETERLEAMWNDFIIHYKANIAVESRPFEGAVETLDVLSGGGATLAVCTNKTQILADQVLAALGLSSYFDAVVGADSASMKKPSGAHIVETVAKANGLLAKSIMVGDSVTDEKAALEAGLPFLFATFGYESAHQDAIQYRAAFDHYAALPRLVADIAQAASVTSDPAAGL